MKPARVLLIVDDSEGDVALVREALAASVQPGEIASVRDGVEAMAFLNRGEKFAGAARPDLVLLDLNMPRKGGLEVLAEMKAGPELRKIPVVIFSTSRLGADVENSYDLGANCYVCKPGNLNEFFSAVKSIEEFWFSSASLPARGE